MRRPAHDPRLHAGSDRSPAAAPRQAGFTLVEMAVATVVLLVVVLLACDLLTESGRLLHHSLRRARDPWTLLAAELLRNDIRGSNVPVMVLPTDPDGFVSTPLFLNAPEGAVAWGQGPHGELVRQVLGGTPHAYMHEVKSFRWRALPGGAVEVWVEMRVSSPYLRMLNGPVPHSDPGEDQDLHVLMVARGGPGTRQW